MDPRGIQQTAYTRSTKRETLAREKRVEKTCMEQAESSEDEFGTRKALGVDILLQLIVDIDNFGTLV